MTDIDLAALSLKELKQLQKDVGKAIETYEDRRKAEVRTKLEAVAKEMGFELSDVMNIEGKRRQSPVAPKYRHPENPSITWSGRGRKPQWFIEALDAGISAADMTIA